MRIIIFCCFCLLLNIVFPEEGQAKPDISASHAVLLDMKTGDVLYDKSAYEPSWIASITKIMTAIIAVESGQLDEQVTVSRNAIYTEGSSIYLEQGEQILLKDLVYGLMLRSGNDAAVAIAEHIGGSEQGFVFLMNEKATWLGMNNTHFDNPHGLDSDDHYASAYDIALLTQYAMTNRLFVEVSGTTRYQSENRSYYWHNKHRLVTGTNEKITGGKTGFTKRTGRTLVTTAKESGMELVLVTLDAPDDWNDHRFLIDWGFEQLEEQKSKQHVDELPTQGQPASDSMTTFLLKVFQKIVGVGG